MSAFTARPLGLRLFLEGVEVPVISSQVSISPGAPAAAAIQVVPTDHVLNLLPRTLVHLFFLDRLSQADTRVPEVPDNEPRAAAQFQTAEDASYKLLFAGELIGLQMQKETGQRCTILQCMDLSLYWDTCYQWFADYSVGGDGLTDREHHFLGAGEGLFDNVTGGTQQVIASLLTRQPQNPDYQHMTGLLGGLIHLFEGIGGLRPRAGTFKGLRGVNDFFTIAELRYNLSGMLGAVEKDRTSQQLYSSQAFFSWLMAGMSSLGSLVSFRDIVNHVAQRIFHQVYPNPAAHFVSAREETKTVWETSWAETPLGGEASDLVNNARDGLSRAKTALEAKAVLDALPHLDGAVSELEKARSLVQASSLFDRAVILTKIGQIQSSLQRPLVQVTRLRGQASTTIDGEGVSALLAPLLAEPLTLIGQLINRGRRTSTPHEKKVRVGDHLFSQLVLPETFFVAPPRCNVLFPDQYSSFTYTRNFMRETTRLAISGGLGLISASRRDLSLLGSFYLAPNIKDAEGKLLREALDGGSRVLLAHEVHSGIVPAFEWVSEANKWGVRSALGVEDSGSKIKIGYMQRLANFQFFLRRFAARSMTVNAAFSPRLVLGFPALVLDRPGPSLETLRQEALRTKAGVPLPTAYLGKIAALVHNVDQNGGTTQVMLQHVRTHRGIDDEFLGVVSREKLGERKGDITIEPLKLSQQTSPDKLQTKLLQMHVLKVLKEGAIVEQSTVVTLLAVGEVFLVESAVRKLGLDVSKMAEDPTGRVLPVPERLTVSLRQVDDGPFVGQDLAAEELLRPGWYDKVWTSERVGTDVYEPLLGVGSLTDELELATDAELEQLLKSSFKLQDGARVELTAEGQLAGSVQITDNEGEVVVQFNRPKAKIEGAIDSLTLLYSALRDRGMAMHEFIGEFTHRPIASMTDVLGTSGLVMDESGVREGVEGFHSRAFGDYNADVKYTVSEDGSTTSIAGKDALVGLLPPGVNPDDFKSGVVNSTKSELKPIPPHIDPRGRARQRVKTYVDGLKSRGLQG